jgi:hypothetical protein
MIFARLLRAGLVIISNVGVLTGWHWSVRLAAYTIWSFLIVLTWAALRQVDGSALALAYVLDILIGGVLFWLALRRGQRRQIA